MNKDDSGKLVLESTLLYPLIMMITVGALFIALFASVQGVVFTKAELAASRASFVWDNSHRNPVTGAFYPGQYDGLYWRLTSDYGFSDLTEKKLSAALASISKIPKKEAEYHNNLWLRQVTTAFEAPLHSPQWMQRLKLGALSKSGAQSIVTDPTEWVRITDMVKLYWPIVKDAITPERADQIVDDFRKREDVQSEPLAFHSHEEALAYMRKIVNGTYAQEDTEEVGEWRMIDGLDRQGVAHQTYIGHIAGTTKQREQMLKDSELLRKGKVNGVVWHFFRRKKDGAIGLSDSLRRDLEERGIVIVIHE